MSFAFQYTVQVNLILVADIKIALHVIPGMGQ